MSGELRVVHMPGRMGGEATIGDTRITCRTVAGMVWAGDSVADLAEDFGVTRDQVRLACWWLVEHAVQHDDWEGMAWEAWRAWAEQWVTLARNGDGDRAGDPTPALPDALSAASKVNTLLENVGQVGVGQVSAGQVGAAQVGARTDLVNDNDSDAMSDNLPRHVELDWDFAWLKGELDAAQRKIKELTQMVWAERLGAERLRSEVARLTRELRVERAITRHDARTLPNPEQEEER